MKSVSAPTASFRTRILASALFALGLGFAAQSARAQSTAAYMVVASMPATNAKPYGPLLLSGGKLYGTTTLPTDGTYFDISETGSTVTSLHALALTQGESPYAPLTMDASGNLYGTAPLGGSTSTGGSVYKSASPYTGTPTRLYGFGVAGATQYGTQPYGPVLVGYNGTSYDGFLYGTCSNAGSGFGTLFKLGSASAGTPTVLHTFIGGTTDGATPYGGLVEDSNGILYGVTETGGAFSAGTVFSISTAGANYTVLHSFGGPGDAAKNPWSGMVLSNGTLYGMTVGGGTGFGAVYSLSTSGAGYSVLHSFNGTTDGGMSSAAGFNPYNQGLVLGADGNLYGTTNTMGSGGGTTTITAGTYAGGGTVFGLTPSGTNFTTLFAFPASGTTGGASAATLGAAPGGGLVQDATTGLFYGTTTVGGSNNDGIIYSITPGLATTTAVPVVNSGTATVAYGQPYSYQITVSSGSPLTSYSATSLPAGLGVNTATGIISGTPAASGTFTINLFASNSGGQNTNAATLTLTVNAPVPFSAIVNPVGLAFSPGGVLNCVNFNGYSGASNAGDVVKILSNGSTLLSPPFVYNLQNPGYPAFDTSGNLYVSETGTGTIYKVTPGGVSSVFASGFNDPIGLAFDASGNLYVAESQGGDVKEVAPNGSISTFATGFSVPTGLTFDSSGNLYVTNYSSGTVSKVTPAGSVSQYASGLSSPWQLAFDSSGNLYVANDAVAGTISEIAPGGGTPTTFASGLTTPTGLAFDSFGDLFVSEFNLNQVIEIQAKPGTYTPPPTPVVNPGTDTDVYGSTYAGYSITVSAGTPTSYGATGLPAGLTVDPLLGTISGTPTASVGTYNATISATNAAGVTGTAAFTFTITQAPLTATANGQNILYSGTAYSGGNGVTLAGLVNGDTFASVTGTLSYSGSSQGAVNVGSYVISPSGLSDPNYSISYSSGTLVISPAAGTVTVPNVTVTYSGSPVNVTATSSVPGLALSYTYNGSPTAPSAAGTYTVAATAANSGNYTITYTSGTLTINPAPLTITASAASKSYDGSAYSGGNGVTYSAFQGSDSSASLAGSVAYAGTSQGAVNVGTYAITPSGLSDPNYSITYASGTLTINAEAVTVTAPSLTVPYNGSPVALPAATISPSVSGLTVSYSYSGSPTAPTNVGSYTVTPVASNSNYTITVVPGSVTITPVLLTVTASNATKNYDGTAFNGGNGVSYAGFQGSDGPASLTGTLGYSGTSQGAVNVGTYAITPAGLSDPNYAISYASGTLTINAEAVTVTAPSLTVPYNGSPVVLPAATISPSVSGLTVTYTYSGSPTAPSNVGTYTVIPAASNSNYTITFVPGTVTITPALLTVTASSATKTYDGIAYSGGNGVTYAGFQGSDGAGSLAGTLAYSGTSQGATNTGSYAITPSGLTDSNYAIAYANGALTINAAPLTVTANNATATYSGTAYTGGNGVKATGLLGSDTVASLGTPAYTGTSQGAINAGNYVITPGGLNNSNYAITYASGTLTISAEAVTVTAPSLTVPYNGSPVALPAATISPSVSGLTVSYSYSGSPTAPSSVGSYAVTPSATNPNYTFTFVPGTVTITPALLTITASSASKTYDGIAYAGGNGVTYAGLQGTDSSVSFGGTLAYTGTSQGATNAGTYVITPGGLTNSNYSISYANGTLTVNAAPLTVTASNATAAYSGTAYSGGNGVKATGLLGSDTVASLGTPSYSGSSQGAINAGSYVIIPGGLSNSNYSITYANGTLTINTVAVTVTAPSLNVPYTAAAVVEPAATVSPSSVTGLTISYTYSGGASAPSNVGNYTVTPAVAASPNYTFTFVPGTITITPASLTVSACNATATYSGTAYSGGNGIKATGLLGSDTVASLGTPSYSGSSQGAINAGNYIITPGGLSDSNYSIAYANGTLTINTVAVTVTAPSLNVIYSAAPVVAPAATVTPSSVTGLSVTYTYSGGPAAPAVVGSYAVTPSATNPNYTFTFVPGTITIAPAPLTVGACNATTTYSGAAYSGGNGLKATGLVGGDTLASLGAPSYSGTSQGAINAGSYVITPGGLSSANYAITYSNGTLTINAAPLTVTANNATATYSGTGYTSGNGVKATGLLGGDTVASLGTPAYTGTSQGAINAGSYVITPGGLSSSNYSITYANGTLTISAAPVTVTAPSLNVVYSGSPVVVPAATISPSSVTGLSITYTYSGGPGAPTNVGNYTVTPAATNPNYSFTFVPGTIAITAAPLTVNACNATATYSGTGYTGGNGVKATGLLGSDTLASLGTPSYSGSSQGAINAGSYIITPGGLSNSNYSITYANGTLTINTAPVTVTAPSLSLPYAGAAVVVPAATVSPSSVTGLSVTYTYSSGSSAPSSVGSYMVTPTVAANPNYSFTYVAGTVTITPAPLTVTACTATATYSGTAFTGGNGVKATGLLGSDTLASLGAPAYSGTSQGAINAGSYVITPGGLSNANYAITYVNGTLTIAAAPVTVTAPSLSIIYNGSAVVVPAATVSPSSVTGLTVTYTYSGGAGAPTSVGSYTVTPSATNPNYTFTFVPGTIAITPAPLTVTACTATATYSGTAYTGGNGIKATGLLGSDTVASLGTPAYTGTSQGAINAGSYVITPGGLNNANYAISYVNGALTINPEPVTIAAPSINLPYTGAAVVVPASTVTPSSVTGLTVTYTYSSTSAPVNAGTYTVTPAATGSNYVFTFTPGTIAITPAPLTVAACNATATYSGTAYTGGNGVKATGLLGSDTVASLGTPAYTGTSQGAINAGSYVITPGGLNNVNYAISYVNGALTINPEPVTIAAPSINLPYTGVAVVVPPSTVTPSSVTGLTVTYTYSSISAPVNAGTYTVTPAATGSNYAFTFTAGTITITPAPLTVAACNATATYSGTAYTGGNGIKATGLLGSDTVASLGTPAYTGTSQGAINAGSYVITPRGLTSANYTISYVNGTLTINPEPVAIVGPSTSIPYTGAAVILPAATITPSSVTGLTVTYTYSSTGVPVNVGTYTVTPAATGSNYAFTFTPGTIKITPAPLTVTACNATTTYSGTAYTGGNGITATSLLGSDTLASLGTPAYTGTSQGAINAGSYVITPRGLSNPNYAISYVNGTLTIKPEAVTITVPNTTVTYTGKPAVVTPATVSPSVSGLTLAYTYAGSPTIPAAVGTYAVTASASNPNYTFTVTNGTLTISPAALTITAKNATATYSGTAYSGGNGVTYAGLLGSDTSASLTGALSYTGTSQGAINVGTYIITPAGLSDPNYAITFVAGNLTISAAKATITVPSTTLMYTGAPAAMPAATISPAISGVTITYTYAGSATDPTNVGTYTVTPAATSANYTFTYVSGTLTITKAVLTVQANNQSLTQGQAIPTLTYTITGFVGSDTQGTAVTGTPQVTTTATSTSAGGTYPITPAQGTLTSANYSFSFVAGTLTIASNAECLVWLEGHCGNQTNCNGGRGYNGCGGYGNLNNYCNSGGYSSSTATQTVTGGCVVPIAFALYNCSKTSYQGGTNYGGGCNGNFMVDTSAVISISELGSDGNLSDPVVYGYSATGPNPPNYWILNNEYLLNFPTASGTHQYVIEVYHSGANGSLQLLGTENLYTISSCLPNPCSTTSSFNSASIARGDTIWFSSIVSLNCPGNQASTVVYDSSTLSFYANGRQVVVNVPAATIKVDPTATLATTTYNAVTNSWATIVPAGYTGNVFLTGAAYPVPSTISGGVSSVTWSGAFRSDCTSIGAQWNWSAAVYTQFNTDASQLGIKPVASSTLSQYANTDLAGTPENYKKYLTVGACGTGGTSYTGTYRSSSSASFAGGCWLDSCTFSSSWGQGWGNGWGYNCSTGNGGAWGNGGSNGNCAGNGGDGACDGNWGWGWNSSGNCSW